MNMMERHNLIKQLSGYIDEYKSYFERTLFQNSLRPINEIKQSVNGKTGEIMELVNISHEGELSGAIRLDVNKLKGQLIEDDVRYGAKDIDIYMNSYLYRFGELFYENMSVFVENNIKNIAPEADMRLRLISGDYCVIWTINLGDKERINNLVEYIANDEYKPALIFKDMIDDVYNNFHNELERIVDEEIASGNNVNRGYRLEKSVKESFESQIKKALSDIEERFKVDMQLVRTVIDGIEAYNTINPYSSEDYIFDEVYNRCVEYIEDMQEIEDVDTIIEESRDRSQVTALEFLKNNTIPALREHLKIALVELERHKTADKDTFSIVGRGSVSIIENEEVDILTDIVIDTLRDNNGVELDNVNARRIVAHFLETKSFPKLVNLMSEVLNINGTIEDTNYVFSQEDVSELNMQLYEFTQSGEDCKAFVLDRYEENTEEFGYKEEFKTDKISDSVTDLLSGQNTSEILARWDNYIATMSDEIDNKDTMEDRIVSAYKVCIELYNHISDLWGASYALDKLTRYSDESIQSQIILFKTGIEDELHDYILENDKELSERLRYEL